MDMKTFKTLEFAAIFGALGWFWWSQRRDRLSRENEQQRQSDTEASAAGSDAAKESTD